MAASMKLVTFCFLFLSFVWLSTAQPLKAENITSEITTIFKDFVVTTGEKASTSSANNMGGIRKMALHKIKEQSDITGENNSKNVSTSSNNVEESSEKQKFEFSQQIGSRFSAAEAMGFVAFQADYSEPQRHPPKNN